jgi:starch phosphorylase
MTDLDQLGQLEKFATDENFLTQFIDVKHENKVLLGEFIRETMGIDVDSDALFDVQIKRLHEYKRQHLNLLHILSLFRRIAKNPKDPAIHSRVFIFGAKAAPGYAMAKK